MSWHIFGIFCTILSLCVNTGIADDNANKCNLFVGNEAFDSRTLNEVEDADPSGKSLLNVTGKDIKAVHIYDSVKYVNVSLTRDDKKNIIGFELKLSEEFKNYEEKETSAEFHFQVLVYCELSILQIVNLILPIKDVNNHPPEFIDAPYECDSSMPLPQNSNFANWCTKNIIVRDIDLSTKNVTVTMDPTDPNFNGFEIYDVKQDKNNKKLYHAFLRTLSIINIKNNLSLNLLAVDDREANSFTTMTLKVNSENSIPRFNHTLYHADHKEFNSSKETIKFKEGDISLIQGADKNIKYTLHVEPEIYHNNFELIVSPNRSSASLNIVDPTESLKQEHFVILTVSANKSVVSEKTVLFISLPGPPKEESLPEPSNAGLTTAVVLMTLLFIASSGGMIYFWNKIRNMRSSYP